MLESRRSALGITAVAFAAAMWGLAANASRYLFDNGTDPLELAEARIFVTALGLLLLIPRTCPGSPTPPGRRKVFWLGVVIALVIATYHLTVLNLPVAVAIVVIYANPALVVLWSAVSSRHLPRPEVVGALVVAMIGVALVSGLGSGEFEDLRWIGLALALATAILFASFTLLAEGAATSYGPLRAIALGFVVASILCLLYQAPLGWPDTLFRRSSLPLTTFVAVFGGLLPFPLYGWGVHVVRAERAAIAATLQPPVAAFVAWIGLGQTLTATQIIGAVLVVLSVASLQIGNPRQKRPRDDPLAQ
jgi:drug/metabolite transporter, DME family